MAAILGATIYDWFHRRNWLRIARGRLADGDPDGTRDRRSAGRPPLSQPTVKFSSSAGPRAMSLPMRRRVGPTKAPTAARGFPLPLDGPLPPGPTRFGPVSYLLEQGQGYRVRKQYEVIGIRAGYSNTAWIDFITTDDQCGGVHFKLAERLWGSILTMKRANVSQEPLIARTRDAPTRERPGLGMGVTACGVSVRA